MRKLSKPAIEGGKPVREEFLIFGKPEIRYEEIEEVTNALKSGWIGTGPLSKKFEDAFREYIGCKHAIAVSSCTAALHLSLLCNGIGPGDDIIVTPMTFAASVNVIEHVGARPIFVDIEEDTYNIDVSKILDSITSKTKAIIPVHFGGLPCDLDPLYKISKENNLLIIEDAAHAVGAEYKKRKIGAIGNPTCFSFYPTKNIVAIEGGMICLKDDEIAEKMRIYAHHGLSKHAWQRFSKEGSKTYKVLYPGYKYNLPDINAAVGIHQLKRIEEITEKRTEYAKIYLDEFENLDLIELPPDKVDRRNVWHLFPILIKTDKLKISRLRFIDVLAKEGVGSGIHYEAIHEQPFYKKKYQIKKGILKEAEYVSERTISIPLQVSMNENDLYDVVKAVKKTLLYYKK